MPLQIIVQVEEWYVNHIGPAIDTLQWSLKAPAQSFDPISCCGKSVEQTNEITSPLIDLISPPDWFTVV